MNEGIHQSREFIRHHISQFPEILDRNENSWWRDTAKFLISFRRELQFYPDIDIRDYFLPQVDFLLQNLRKYSSLAPKDLDDFVSFADHMIMNFSMETATLFETKEFKAK